MARPLDCCRDQEPSRSRRDLEISSRTVRFLALGRRGRTDPAREPRRAHLLGSSTTSTSAATSPSFTSIRRRSPRSRAIGRNEIIRDYEGVCGGKDGSVKHVLIDSSVLWTTDVRPHRCFTRTSQRRLERSTRGHGQTARGDLPSGRSRGPRQDLSGVCDAAVASILASAPTQQRALSTRRGVMRFQAWRNLSDGYRRRCMATPVVARYGLAGPDRRGRRPERRYAGTLRDVVLPKASAPRIRPLVSHCQRSASSWVYYDAPHVFSPEELDWPAHRSARRLRPGAGSFGRRHRRLLTPSGRASRGDAARVESEGRRVIAEELGAAGAGDERDARCRLRRRADRRGGTRLVRACSGLRLAAPDGSLSGSRSAER